MAALPHSRAASRCSSAMAAPCSSARSASVAAVASASSWSPRASIALRASRALPALSTRRVTTPARTSRLACAAAKGYKVALLGAAGGIGQPLALLLKMQPYISQLALYDIANVKGVAAELSHCNTAVQVSGHTGPDELAAALSGADLVIIPAGVPRKPGMTRDDLFNINAGIVHALAVAVAQHCPKAVLNIISNPVNSTVPIAAEVLKAAGVYDPKKLLGVTTLDVVRANTFVAEAKGLDVADVDVPVVGGHAGTTILPLLSQATPKVSFSEADAAAMTERIQNAGTEVVEAKAGAGSATLSMAYAAARMAESVLRGLDGEDGVVECAYVASSVTSLPFFASKVRLGRGGVVEVFPFGDVNAAEAKGVEELIPVLQKNIETGVAFAASKK